MEIEDLTQDANGHGDEVSQGDVQPSLEPADKNMTDQDYVKLTQIIDKK